MVEKPNKFERGNQLIDLLELKPAKEEDVKKLRHLNNLQLLNAEDNIAKSDSLDWRLRFGKEQGTSKNV